METIFERVGALDVHKVQVTACVRVPDGAGRREPHLAEFATTVAGLLALADWLAAFAVTHVAMEATGVYWQPVWQILEDDLELMLVNAQHVKNVPGRKTDVSDAQWLCQLMEAGLLRSSFVPPKPQRRLRALTRYRKTQIAERQREANRLHKALEDAGIKLDCVASDILGKSGRAMLDALVAGTTDPQVLADLARGRLRTKIPSLREALQGRFEPHHALLIGAILPHLDFLDEQINGLSDAIEAQLGPTGLAGVALASTITGVAARTGEVLVAEIGTDMSVFPSAGHLASWAGRCPGNDRSAGKRLSRGTRKGSKWLGIALEEAALAAIRSKGTYLAAQYQRLKPRLGHGRALGAVKHSILIAYWHMFTNGETYHDLGGDYFQRRDPERATKRLVAKLEALGHRHNPAHSRLSPGVFPISSNRADHFPRWLSYIRSTDKGATWRKEERVDIEFPGSILSGRNGDSTIDVEPVPCPDPAENGSCPIRSGDFIPDVAVDPRNGNLYAVWMDLRFDGGIFLTDHDNIAFTMSSDGGRTWLPTIKVNQTPTNEPNYDQQAFTPAVDVAADGTVTVTYYDFRNNTGSPASLDTDYFAVHCHASCADPASWAGNETRITPTSFDIRKAPYARGYFVGDYMGLASAGSDFLAVFGQAFAQNDANQYVSRLSP